MPGEGIAWRTSAVIAGEEREVYALGLRAQPMPCWSSTIRPPPAGPGQHMGAGWMLSVYLMAI